MLPFQIGRIKLDNRAPYGALPPVVNAADQPLRATYRPRRSERNLGSLWVELFVSARQRLRAPQRVLHLAVDLVGLRGWQTGARGLAIV